MNTASLQNRRGFLKTFFGGAALLGASGMALRGGANGSAVAVPAVTTTFPSEENSPAASSYEDETGYDDMCDPGWSY